MRNKYFVSYQINFKDGTSFFGNGVVEYAREVSNIDDIRSLENTIAINMPKKEVKLISLISLTRLNRIGGEL
jgi:hypothetical protein